MPLARPTTVLCVDDQIKELELQKEFFESHNFRVLIADNWLEAKVLLSMNEVDVVVLDYRLVQANAVDVAIEVRKDRPRVPIMLLSGFLQEVPEYFRRAVDGCVSKSSPMEEWVETLKILAGSSGDAARAV